jgi:hypothetical protein
LTAGKLSPMSLALVPYILLLPYPSCPRLFAPQHLTDPSSSTAHVCRPPAHMSVIVLPCGFVCVSYASTCAHLMSIV